MLFQFQYVILSERVGSVLHTEYIINFQKICFPPETKTIYRSSAI